MLWPPGQQPRARVPSARLATKICVKYAAYPLSAFGSSLRPSMCFVHVCRLLAVSSLALILTLTTLAKLCRRNSHFAARNRGHCSPRPAATEVR